MEQNNPKLRTLKVKGVTYDIDADTSNIIGNAGEDYNTLGKLESQINTVKSQIVGEKTYSEGSDNGMGRKILAKNSLFDDQLTQENTVYVIQYDYDLDGQTVTVPENSVLKFEGGSIDNGEIVGQNTVIDAKPVKIFGNDVELTGDFVVENFYTEWHGAKADGETVCNDAFQKSCDNAIRINAPIQLLGGTYIINDNGIFINFNKDGQSWYLIGSGMGQTTVKMKDGEIDRLVSEGANPRWGKLFYHYGRYSGKYDVDYAANTIKIADITFDMNKRSNTVTPPERYAWESNCIFASSCSESHPNCTVDNYIFENIYIKDKIGSGLKTGGMPAKNVIFNNIIDFDENNDWGTRESIYPLAVCDNIQIKNCNVRYLQIEPTTTQSMFNCTKAVIDNCFIWGLEWNNKIAPRTYGYYYNDLFYEDQDHTIELTKDKNILYCDTITDDAYQYIEITQGGQIVESYFKKIIGKKGEEWIEPSKSSLILTNSTINYLNLSGDDIQRINNCNFILDSANWSIISNNLAFDNCDFKFVWGEDRVTSMQFRTDYGCNNVVFDNCRFVSTENINNLSGANASVFACTNTSAESNRNIKFDRCYFDIDQNNKLLDSAYKGFYTVKDSIIKFTGDILFSGGAYTLSGRNHYGYTNCINNTIVNNNAITTITNSLQVAYCGTISGNFEGNSIVAIAETGAQAPINVVADDLVVYNNNFDIASNLVPKGAVIVSNGIRYTALKTPINRNPLAVNTENYTAEFVNKKMTTAEREALTNLPNLPMEAYDVTLNKPVYWTGSDWVDATGEPLS